MLLRSSYYLSVQSGGVAGGCSLLSNNYLFINNYLPESAFDRVNILGHSIYLGFIPDI